MRTARAALASAWLASAASAAGAGAQVAAFDNSAGTFVWVPALLSPSTGQPVLAERTLDLTLGPQNNQAGLSDPVRALSYGVFPPLQPGDTRVDRVLRLFPQGTAGISLGEFFNFGTDSGHYARTHAPGESVEPAATQLFPTNAGLAPHTDTGASQTLGRRITIGVRFQADSTGEDFHYGYVTLEWRDNLVFPSIAGGTTTLSMYQPVAWAYELTPNVAIAIPEEQTEPDCPADTNGDGSLTPADFSAWIAAFNAMAPACDQNGDTLCTPADFSAWIAGFNAGC